LVGAYAPCVKSKFVWDCWDTQMRSQSHYIRKLEYVADNPVRQGLAQCSEDWPYQGRMNELRW